MHALYYQITIHSSLTVDDTHFDAYAKQLNSLTMVQRPPKSKDQILLYIVGGKNISHCLVCQGGFGVPEYPSFQVVFMFKVLFPAER